jgi:tRNA1Val (adenine37-N6)-methyltransferase
LSLRGSKIAMSNTYFQFKQFTIHQQNVAMKVCTDACLFGAWVAAKIKDSTDIQSILDIGTGTGLLSLMIAQKSKAVIDAVEIDTAAALQAKENIDTSSFKNQIHVIEGDIKHITFKKAYDLIISNPPFFNNDLKSENQKRNLALHSEALSFDDLLSSAALITNNGAVFSVLLPWHRTNPFISKAASYQFFLREQVLVRQTEKHNYFRSMLCFVKKQTVTTKKEIIIKKEGQYSPEFIELLKDYYLYL